MTTSLLNSVRLAALLALVSASAVATADSFDAETYHRDTCMRCHGTDVYTRDNRRVTSYPALQAQVARCDANLGTKLFPEDLGLLVDHLNDQYYRFAK
jgi:hypothetical protein